MHIGHSWLASRARLALVLMAGARVVPLRNVPDALDDEDRRVFLAIGERAAAEAVHCYSVVGLGLQAYLSNEAVRVEESNKGSSAHTATGAEQCLSVRGRHWGHSHASPRSSRHGAEVRSGRRRRQPPAPARLDQSPLPWSLYSTRYRYPSTCPRRPDHRLPVP